MRRILVLFLILTTIVTAFSSCARQDNEELGPPDDPGEPGGSNGGDYVFNYGENTASSPVFYRKVAREVREDGWVYTFMYDGLKEGYEGEVNLHHYSFSRFNIRYKYNEKNVQADRDMELIRRVILDNSRSIEELLALNPDDYEFEFIEKDMFFRLMRDALTGEPQKEGTDQAYWDKQYSDLLVEPEYIDGYKFQIAYLNATGCVDEFYIDIRYQTGDGYADYVQLSDLVDAGTATDEQKETFEKLREIAENIKEHDSYFAGAEEWRNLELAGINFSRLYTMLDRLYWNQEIIYREEDPHIEMIEGME